MTLPGPSGLRRLLPQLRLLLMVATVLAGAAPQTWATEWYEHYRRATDAVEAGRCQEAIELLENKLLPTLKQPKKNKRMYGMNYIDYLPHYTLGLAYLCADEPSKALEKFDAARQAGVIMKTSRAKAFRQSVAKAEAAQQASARPSPVPTAITPPRQPSVAPADRRFVEVADAARQALADKRCSLALRKLGEAQGLDPGKYSEADLAGILDEANRCVQEADRLTREAAALLRQGKLSQARLAYERADATHHGRGDVADGLREVERAEQQVAARKRRAASSKAKRTAVSDEPSDARQNQPAARAASDTKARENASRLRVLRQALRDLYLGETRKAITNLEQQTRQPGPLDPDVPAYLGVAYATLGYESTEPQETARLEALATQQFRSALKLEPAYALHQRLVSPRIRELFSEAKPAP